MSLALVPVVLARLLSAIDSILNKKSRQVYANKFEGIIKIAYLTQAIPIIEPD